MTRSRRYAGRDGRVRMCTSKTRMTMRNAQRFAAKVGLRAYHCPVCCQWHVARREASDVDAAE